MIGPQIHADQFPDGSDYEAIRSVYGDPRPLLRANHAFDQRAELAWKTQILSPFPVPFPKPVQLAGCPPGTIASRVFAHRSLFDELVAVFTELVARDAWRHVASFAGCYNFRLIRAGTQPSLHSWGVALDFNSERYPLGTEPDPKDPFVLEVLPVFKERGWTLGAEFGRPDVMHVEATNRSAR